MNHPRAFGTAFALSKLNAAERVTVLADLERFLVGCDNKCTRTVLHMVREDVAAEATNEARVLNALEPERLAWWGDTPDTPADV